MTERLTWWVNDRDPSITDQITVNGTPVDLTTKTARFKMRAFGSTTLKVDQAVSSKDANGVWRYDWQATDLDTAGNYLVWVEVTTGTKVQTLWESAITVAAHAPQSLAYIELEELKTSTELTSTTYADQDLRNAIVAASRVVDKLTGQRFYPDVDAAQVRYYSASPEAPALPGYRHWHSAAPELLRIDPLVTITSLQTDSDDDGVIDYTWVEGTDFVLEPKNAVADGRPYDAIRRLRRSSYRWPLYPDAIKVTGKFGWAAPPEAVKVMTTILAARYTKRLREAPFGIAGFDAIGAVVRISQFDPDIAQLVDSIPGVHRPLFV